MLSLRLSSFKTIGRRFEREIKREIDIERSRE